jgi:hypothetical protein
MSLSIRNLVMKKPALALMVLILTAQSILGFVDLDRGGIILETEFFAQHDNNITGNANKESDLILSVDPTLQYERRGRGTVSASLGMNFIRFEEFSDFDSENLHGDFNLGFPVAAGSPFSGNFSFGYREQSLVDQFVNERINSKVTNLNLSGQYRLRQRVSARGNITYTDTDSERFSKMEDQSASLGLIIDDVWQDVGVTLMFQTPSKEQGLSH